MEEGAEYESRVLDARIELVETAGVAALLRAVVVTDSTEVVLATAEDEEASGSKVAEATTFVVEAASDSEASAASQRRRASAGRRTGSVETRIVALAKAGPVRGGDVGVSGTLEARDAGDKDRGHRAEVSG